MSTRRAHEIGPVRAEKFQILQEPFRPVLEENSWCACLLPSVPLPASLCQGQEKTESLHGRQPGEQEKDKCVDAVAIETRPYDGLVPINMASGAKHKVPLLEPDM